MPLDDVPSHAVAGAQGAFQVDPAPRRQGPQTGALEGLSHDIGDEDAVGQLRDGQAAAVDTDRVARARALDDDRSSNRQSGGARLQGGAVLQRNDLPELLNDSGEHQRFLYRDLVA